ncbi:MAG: response regulator [Pseudohongiellaceae bacterium]
MGNVPNIVFKPRLLVIDDDEFVAGVIKEAAEQCGYVVSCVYNGKLVVSQLSSFKPDVIFLDLVLPGFDGVELVNILVESSCKAKLVVMSGLDKRTLQSVGNSARNGGLDLLDSLSKPVTSQVIHSILTPLYDSLSSECRVESPANRYSEYGPQILAEPILCLAESSDSAAERLFIKLIWRLDNGQFTEFDRLIVNNKDLETRMGSFEVLLDKLIEANTHMQQSGRMPDYRLALDMALLANSNLPSFLVSRLAGTGLDPARIMFELTTEDLPKDDQKTLDAISRLKIKGFAIAVRIASGIDDALAMLKHNAADMLIIDMSTTLKHEKTLSNLESEFQFSSLVASAIRTGVTVAAICVDSPQQLEFARRCQFAEVRGRAIKQPEVIQLQ